MMTKGAVVGMAAGAAFKGVDGYQMATKRAVYVTDELSRIRIYLGLHSPDPAPGVDLQIHQLGCILPGNQWPSSHTVHRPESLLILQTLYYRR